jgi:hypothetical protein
MPDKRVYKAGDTITAKMKLKPGPPLPTMVSVALNIANPVNSGPSRVAGLQLQWFPGQNNPNVMPTVAPDGTIITLIGTVPKLIVGGAYRAVQATMDMPDGTQQIFQNVDPDGDFTREIDDDPPAQHSVPVILDLD